MPEITDADVRTAYDRLRTQCRASGYFLNPDEVFTRDLVRGLLVNEKRYGYQACPCRLASGDADDDRDIVCPCDYRDPDISEHGACYCALYVSESAAKGKRGITPVPERRPSAEERKTGTRPAAIGVQHPLRQQSRRSLPPQRFAPPTIPEGQQSFAYPVWRCRVCGYLCARGEPPEICPICKAKRDRFEQFA
jgi:ferredoxin-thioredoxin reductase catalytic subunit